MVPVIRMSGIATNTMVFEAVIAPTNVPAKHVKRAKRSKEEVDTDKKEIAAKKTEREITKKQKLFDQQKRAIDKDMLLLEKKRAKCAETDKVLTLLKSTRVQTEQPQTEQPHVQYISDSESVKKGSQSDDESDEETDSEEEQAREMENYLANKVDIFSEESILRKIPDIPTCACGGHSVCLGCKTKWNITLTQKHCRPFDPPAPGEEFICIRQFDVNAEDNCFSDVVGTLPCVLCLEHGSEGSNNNNARWIHGTSPEVIPMLIGEHGRCPGCLMMVGVADECELCSYPVHYMNK